MSDERIQGVENAARLAMEILSWSLDRVEAGVVPLELAEAVGVRITDAGAVPVLLGYPSGVDHVPPFPAAACIGVNNKVVNAIPGTAPLKAGDLVSVDVALSLDGWHADVADAVSIGGGSDLPSKLAEAMDQWLATPWAGLDGQEVGRLAWEACESRGLRVLPEHLIHGIGDRLHKSPSVMFKDPERQADEALEAGVTVAAELAATKFSQDVWVKIDDDGWTRRTAVSNPGVTRERVVLLGATGNRVLGEVNGPRGDVGGVDA